MRWLGILLVLVLSAGIVAYFAWLAFLFAIDGGLVAAFVPVLILIPAVRLAVVIHELGHLLAGLAAGFRIRQLNILTLSLDLESGAVGFRLTPGADMLGYVGFGLAEGAR